MSMTKTTFDNIGRQVLHKVLIILEIIVGYAVFSLTSAVGVWLIFGQFVPLGRLFNTMQEINGISILPVSLITAMLFLAIIYGLQRLRRQSLGELGLRSPSISLPRFLMLSIGLPVLGQALLLTAQKLIGESAEANLSIFDLATPLSVLGWIGVGWIQGGFSEELLYRGFLLTRLEMLFGKRPWSTILAVLLLVAFFGLGHAYQGATGMVLTAISSLVFWGVYFLSKRNLWASIVSHGFWDTIGWLLMISGL